jgi:hypothetical protein
LFLLKAAEIANNSYSQVFQKSNNNCVSYERESATADLGNSSSFFEYSAEEKGHEAAATNSVDDLFCGGYDNDNDNDNDDIDCDENDYYAAEESGNGAYGFSRASLISEQPNGAWSTQASEVACEGRRRIKRDELAKRNELIRLGIAKCSVCGDVASMIRFGVELCHGCKEFFRRHRTLLSTERIECIYGTNKCQINTTNRNQCKRCRYERCVQLGMTVPLKRVASSICSSASKKTSAVTNDTLD